MTYRGIARAGTCMATLGALMLGPVAGASASSASIKAAFESYSGKIDVAEGHAVTAIGEYKTSKNPAAAQAAIGESITVLSGLKSKVAAQSAGKPKVKKAKRKIEEGLAAVIASYRLLSTAIGEDVSNPEAAKAETAKAEVAVKRGRKELLEGVKLLA
jgi:hypothetical protein